MKVAASVVALIAAAVLAPSAGAASTVTCGEGIAHSIAVANDLSHCPGNGLNVEADGITIDLQGHKITGSTNGSGIEFNQKDNVTVRNGRVESFGAGVDMGGDHGRFQRVTLHRNTTGAIITGDWNLFSGGSVTQSSLRGVFGFGGAHNTITSFTAASIPGPGVELSSGHDNVVHRVLVENVENGITLDDEANDTVSLSTVFEVDQNGVHVLNGSSGTTLNDNFAGRNGTGYLIENSSGTTFNRNYAVQNDLGFEALGAGGVNFNTNYAKTNAGAGFTIAGGTTGASLFRNLAGSTHRTAGVTNEGNATGIVIGPASGTVLTQNDANHNKGSLGGIVVNASASGTQLLRNIANYNAGNGITASSSSTTLTGNSAARNTGFGIFAVPGVTDGGGNHASGNGAGQCTNVFCS
jgi:hypothetical protein